jgi:hypothetical protein
MILYLIHSIVRDRHTPDSKKSSERYAYSLHRAGVSADCHDMACRAGLAAQDIAAYDRAAILKTAIALQNKRAGPTNGETERASNVRA